MGVGEDGANSDDWQGVVIKESDFQVLKKEKEKKKERKRERKEKEKERKRKREMEEGKKKAEKNKAYFDRRYKEMCIYYICSSAKKYYLS